MNKAERQFLEAMQAEEERLAFAMERDGEEGAKAFAINKLTIYSDAMNCNKPNIAKTREHKYKFFASCLVFEAYLGLPHYSYNEKEVESDGQLCLIFGF